MRLILVFLLALVGCDSAGPGFRGLPAVERSVDGARFTLRQSGAVVEAIRTNPEVLPRFQPVARKAAIAAQIETGCHAEWVQGDPAMMLIGLSCGGAQAPKPPKRRAMFCDLSQFTLRDGVGEGLLHCTKL